MHMHADAAVGPLHVEYAHPWREDGRSPGLAAGWLVEGAACNISRVVQTVSSTAKQETERAVLHKHGPRAAGPSAAVRWC